MAKKLINLRVEEKFLNQIKTYAKDHYMTLTSFIIRSVQEYIIRHKDE